MWTNLLTHLVKKVNGAKMIPSERVRKHLEELAEEAYWSINEAFKKKLEQIGEVLCKYYFPDRGRKTIIIWKNLDAIALAQPFEKLGQHLLSVKISTERLSSSKREIKNITEIGKSLQSVKEKADVLLILDAVAGSGLTALKIKEESVKALGYEPTIYFYSVFGSTGLENKIKKEISNSKVVKEYPMDEKFNPPRLEWFIMSDLGDRYPERNSGGLLIETPLDEQKWIKQRISSFFSPSQNWTIFQERLIINMVDLYLIGGAVYFAQKDARQYGFDQWVSEDSIIALVNFACKEEPKLKEHFAIQTLQKDESGHLKNAAISTFLRDFEKYGNFVRKGKKDSIYWRLPDCMMTYFYGWVEPTLSSEKWFIKLKERSYDAIANPERMISLISDGV
jgi:hypothetical protein